MVCRDVQLIHHVGRWRITSGMAEGGSATKLLLAYCQQSVKERFWSFPADDSGHQLGGVNSQGFSDSHEFLSQNAALTCFDHMDIGEDLPQLFGEGPLREPGLPPSILKSTDYGAVARRVFPHEIPAYDALQGCPNTGTPVVLANYQRCMYDLYRW